MKQTLRYTSTVILECQCLMKTNVPATFLLLKMELRVNHEAYEKALTGRMEKASAWDIYCIP